MTRTDQGQSLQGHEAPGGFLLFCHVIVRFVTDYTEEHAKAGVGAQLPAIECWANQFPDYDIQISNSEYTSICPKTGLPDFGTITIQYRPDKLCLELKSLKMYIPAYRDLGIFYENAVNKILRDVVAACQPLYAKVTGNFTTRGGMSSVIETEYRR